MMTPEQAERYRKVIENLTPTERRLMKRRAKYRAKKFAMWKSFCARANQFA